MFEGGNFSKSGSIVESNKQRGSSGAFARIPDYKLQNKSLLEFSPKQSVNKKIKPPIVLVEVLQCQKNLVVLCVFN